MNFSHPTGAPPEVVSTYLAQLQAELDKVRAAVPHLDAMSAEQVHHLRGFLHYAEHLDDYMRELIGQMSDGPPEIYTDVQPRPTR